MNGRTTTGTILAMDNGVWKRDVTVPTEEEAIAVLDQILGRIQ
jgi:hypothetical protein